MNNPLYQHDWQPTPFPSLVFGTEAIVNSICIYKTMYYTCSKCGGHARMKQSGWFLSQHSTLITEYATNPKDAFASALVRITKSWSWQSNEINCL